MIKVINRESEISIQQVRGWEKKPKAFRRTFTNNIQGKEQNERGRRSII